MATEPGASVIDVAKYGCRVGVPTLPALPAELPKPCASVTDAGMLGRLSGGPGTARPAHPGTGGAGDPVDANGTGGMELKLPIGPREPLAPSVPGTPTADTSVSEVVM